MFDLVLYQPEIPPNTGNIIRLCANTGTGLHLVKPLGFPLDHAKMRRAGLDYHEFASIQVYEDWPQCREHFAGRRLFAATTKGTAIIGTLSFVHSDVFVLGPETRGLPANILAEFPAARRVRIPMLAHSRSLNLSNAAAVLIYEAWRQCGFAGAV